MKIFKIIIILIFSFLFFSIAQSFDSDDLEKVKNKKDCVKCDLTNINLQGFDLSGIDVSGSDFSNSDLRGSDFDQSNLKNVLF